MMARRRKKNNLLNIFLIILMIGILAIIFVKITQNKETTPDNKEDKTKQVEKKDTKETKEDNKQTDKKEEEKTETTPSKTEVKPSSDEKTENKNENNRRGGSVTLDLVGEDEITVSVGSDYKDAGCNAKYSDGSDASSDIEVENTVDTSTPGTYTVTYYYGNSVVIRRVTVE